MKVQNNISALNRNLTAKNKVKAKDSKDVSKVFEDALDESIEETGAEVESSKGDEFESIIEQANMARVVFENSANVTKENIDGTTNSIKNEELAKKIMTYKK